jgi:hypothetical protein
MPVACEWLNYDIIPQSAYLIALQDSGTCKFPALCLPTTNCALEMGGYEEDIVIDMLYVAADEANAGCNCNRSAKQCL